jgi:branched-chain amino acid transport system substrate-binding protein
VRALFRPARVKRFTLRGPCGRRLDSVHNPGFATLRTALRIGAAVALAAACGCGGERAPVVIAAAGPWDEIYGQMNKRGIDLALEEINAAGGAGGRRVQLEIRNDHGDGMRAANIAAELVGNPAVIAVVGHVNSGAMVAAARVYDQGLPAVSTTASTPDLTGISPWVFRVISSDSVNGLDLARYARRLGFGRAAILYENNAYGRGLAESFQRHFDGSIVTADPIPADGASDFEPYVAFLRAHAPDVVFVAGTEASGVALLREARRQGLKAAFMGADGWTSVVRDTAASEGAYIGAPFSPEDARPEAQRFVAAFRQKYHLEPDGNAALAYDATRLVAQAISEVGASRTRVRDWLASRSASTAFPGVTGSIRFLSTGDVVGKGYVMTRVHRGALAVDRAGP